MLFDFYGTFFKGSVKNLFFLECEVTIYEKIKFLTLVQADLTYWNIQKKLGVSNGCISNIPKKEERNLSLKNGSGPCRKKLTTLKEDRHLIR
jgi:hypothetical protein